MDMPYISNYYNKNELSVKVLSRRRMMGEEKKEEDNQKEVFSFQIQGKKKKRGLNLSLWEPATTYASRRFPAKYFQRAEA